MMSFIQSPFFVFSVGYAARMRNLIQLQKYLGGGDSPADKRTCAGHAQDDGADNDIVEMLAMRRRGDAVDDTADHGR
jgi:hypothetical protein